MWVELQHLDNYWQSKTLINSLMGKCRACMIRHFSTTKQLAGRQLSWDCLAAFSKAPTGFSGEIPFQNMEQALRNLNTCLENEQGLSLHHSEKQSKGCCYKYPHKTFFGLISILRTKDSKGPSQTWPTHLHSARGSRSAMLRACANATEGTFSSN